MCARPCVRRIQRRVRTRRGRPGERVNSERDGPEISRRDDVVPESHGRLALSAGVLNYYPRTFAASIPIGFLPITNDRTRTVSCAGAEQRDDDGLCIHTTSRCTVNQNVVRKSHVRRRLRRCGPWTAPNTRVRDIVRGVSAAGPTRRCSAAAGAIGGS